MLQEKLKSATAGRHDETESLMYVDEIMSGSLSLSQYQHILQVNYLVHLFYETAIHQKIERDIAESLALEDRLKLPALRKDLMEAGLESSTAALARAMEPCGFTVEDEPFALGALYVLEGATLGGQVILKKLQRNGNFMNKNIHLHYYNVYADEVIARWKTFVNVLNTIEEKHHARAIEGANAVYDSIARFAKKLKQE